jgi:hypothetical protein
MRADHDQLEIVSDKTIGEEILRCVHLEFVDKDTSEIPFLLLSDGRILQDLADLIVENPLLLLAKSSDFFPKGT